MASQASAPEKFKYRTSPSATEEASTPMSEKSVAVNASSGSIPPTVLATARAPAAA